MNCKFCNKESLSARGIAMHQRLCLSNPQRWSPTKGKPSKRKGQKFGPLSEVTKLKIAAKSGNRKVTDETREKLSLAFKGKTHTAETKLRIAEKMKGNQNGDHRGDRRSMYRDIRMDSSWEVKVAEYLDSQNIAWEYGARTFEVDEKRSYRPDFKLSDTHFLEVKGYWRPENLAKFEKVKELYPDIKFEVWDKLKLKSLAILC